MDRAGLQQYLDAVLEVGRFKDYCPNGLQVEGRDEIRQIVCGVTASQALLDAAVARGADVGIMATGSDCQRTYLYQRSAYHYRNFNCRTIFCGYSFL